MWLECLGKFASITDSIAIADKFLSELKSTDLLHEFNSVLKIIDITEAIKEKCDAVLKIGENFISLHEKKSENLERADSFQDTSLIPHDPGSRPQIKNTNQRNYLISLGPHQPTLIRFPKDKQGNRFNPSWYQQFPHLEYSIVKNAAFCFTCILFPNSSNTNEWFTTGVQKFKKMCSRGGNKVGKLQSHFSSRPHRKAMEDYRNFLVKTGHIDVALNKEARNILMEAKRQKIFHAEVINILFDVTRTLAKQGLAFRGSSDDSDGNFVQIVHLLARHNSVLKTWLEKRSERSYHVNYLSPNSQNEFIELLGKEVQSKVISEIQAAPLYTIMADTTPDSSHKDMISLIVRFVDTNGILKE